MNDKQTKDLMRIVSGLSRKKHSGEVSSVSYDEAEELMEAVMYCINENGNAVINTTENTDIPAVYRAGYDRVINKVNYARNRYNKLTEIFNSYGCDNYRDTVLKGLPRFFLYYDPELKPQEHLLTLDYPLADWGMNGHKFTTSGIDLIAEYIDAVYDEQKMLNCFTNENVIEILRKTTLDRTKYFMDNILLQVLYYEFKKAASPDLIEKGMNLLIIKSNVNNPEYFEKLIKSYFNK